MTIIYTVEAFERVDELLVFEIDIPKEKFPEIARVMAWTDEEYNDFIAGMGGGLPVCRLMQWRKS
ncbi:hypothetical protein NG99_12650 [Erwinia typographi]|uniref:DUF7683 domain-containing protein n=1 Tax=Erwinia typographi TaxID=371042 RepID=A0A0A3Z5Z7_9GAMM|nr:hypothetical protein [Erwinia typographi]KGT93046.1 hypothetical protein NG99_12650 [Erwinia typographi]